MDARGAPGAGTSGQGRTPEALRGTAGDGQERMPVVPQGTGTGLERGPFLSTAASGQQRNRVESLASWHRMLFEAPQTTSALASRHGVPGLPPGTGTGLERSSFLPTGASGLVSRLSVPGFPQLPHHLTHLRQFWTLLGQSPWPIPPLIFFPLEIGCR